MNERRNQLSNHQIVIVGAGFASAALVVHLLKGGARPKDLIVIGNGLLGAGNAYGCKNNIFRLNVREDLPIIFSDDPLDFARWAQENIDDPEAKTNAGYFYRRQDFAQYMNSLVKKYDPHSEVQQIFANVTQIIHRNEEWELTLDTKKILVRKNLVLATGNAPPHWPCEVDINHDVSVKAIKNSLVENPWTGNWIQDVHPTEEIILLGGGLTALDAINVLATLDHQGSIRLISPRSTMPPQQAYWSRSRQPPWPKSLTPASLVRFMRRYLPASPPSDSDWQSAWEEMRPQLNTIWQSFSSLQRKKLLKRLGWLWSLYRFRASPQTIQSLHKLALNHQIHTEIARAQKIELVDDKVIVHLNNGKKIQGDRLINCAGVGKDLLSQSLITQRIALPDALGQSIAVNSDCQVMHSQTVAWGSFFMIGPGTMGSLGDVVAASSIAAQAEKLSKNLMANILSAA
jgi:uncharacterized NAD(P)/FAD-binding protein YdhS